MRPLDAASQLPAFGPDHPLVQALSNRREPLLLSGDAGSVEEVALHVSCEELLRVGLRAFIPIRAGDDLIGVLACGSGEGRRLHPEDLALMQIMAHHLAGVLGACAPSDTGTGPSTDRWAGRAERVS